MKCIVLLFCLILSVNFANAQANLSSNKKLISLCKVWGFLKYYHPAVASGKFNWDKQLTDHIEEIKAIDNKSQLSRFYLNWINSLGTIPRCTGCGQLPKKAFTRNLNLQWLNDSGLFSDKLMQKLQYIKNNRNQGANYYVSKVRGIGNTVYSNEKTYKDSLYPSEDLRLLGLFRYWNIVNYFFPYKYKMDEDWNKALTEMIPVFENANDKLAYNLAIMELTAKIDDTHAQFWDQYLKKYWLGAGYFPFSLKIIHDSAVVNSIKDDSLAAIDNIRFGDVIIKIGNKPISRIIKSVWKYIGASNSSVKYRFMVDLGMLFVGHRDSAQVTYVRDGIMHKTIVHRYTNIHRSASKKIYYIIDESIGYINMGLLKKKAVGKVLNKLKDEKAIIFDLRNYPESIVYQLSDILNKKRKPFVKGCLPDINYPGIYSFAEPIYCGHRNRNYYKGKIIVLINEYTQSLAEFTCMALQTAPDVTLIGSQTAGADGNISKIPLPGGYYAYMSGVGVYYPNGKETQRIGIVPDIVVKPTIKGIQEHKDEVLDRAIEFIEKGK